MVWIVWVRESSSNPAAASGPTLATLARRLTVAAVEARLDGMQMLRRLPPSMRGDSPPPEGHPMSDAAATDSLLPTSHHGSWNGDNRLWITDPAKPFRSAGTVELSGGSLRYTWSHRERSHTGELALKGPPAALAATWSDSFHATDPFTLHGYRDSGVVRLFTTYDAGETTWGWQIELDLRDPEACTMRMFNVIPEIGAVPAVVLHATRPS